MPNETAQSNAEAQPTDPSAFFLARVRVEPKRFALAFWDMQPMFLLSLALFPLVVLGMYFIELPAGAVVLLALALLVVSARRALVVAPEGAWVEQRVAGLRWRRLPLGKHPTVFKETGVDWQKLSVASSDLTLRSRSRHDKRGTLAEWDGANTRKNENADRLVAMAKREIKRLHSE